MDGDDAIRALAEKIDTRLAYGLCSGEIVLPAPGTVDTVTSGTVTFPAGFFTTVPRGVATVQNTTPTAFNSTSVGLATASGMLVASSRKSGPGSTILVNWMAHGV
jgi:hypothetical protein